MLQYRNCIIPIPNTPITTADKKWQRVYRRPPQTKTLPKKNICDKRYCGGIGKKAARSPASDSNTAACIT